MSTTSTKQGKVLANTFIKTYVSYLYEVRSGTCLPFGLSLDTSLTTLLQTTCSCHKHTHKHMSMNPDHHYMNSITCLAHRALQLVLAL